MNPESLTSEIGIGATDELSLRLSVATLVRVLFEHPTDGGLLLALERKATLLDREKLPDVDVKSQPFGGAIRLLDPNALQKRIGSFNFDSEESRDEQDFRIFIRPSHWKTVQEFCLRHFNQLNDSVLESDPTRELAEEVACTLGISLQRDQYSFQKVGTIIEDDPSPTENIHARGFPTIRIYRIFEARILDPSLAAAMIRNSETCSNQDLRELALQDYSNGGPGRANAVLTLSFKEINTSYLTVPLEQRNTPIWFQGYRLDETVAAVLDGVTVPKYRRPS
jgi:hypothetical protein